jgi:hypothetical protein
VILAVAFCLVVAGVDIGLGVALSKKNLVTTTSGASGGPGASSTGSASPSTSTSGGPGSIVTFDNGTKDTYQINFGGDHWAMDPKNPFGPGGKAQS